MWESAYSDVMVSQQTQIAQLLAEIEEIKQREEKLKEKTINSDPHRRLQTVRQEKVSFLHSPG